MTPQEALTLLFNAAGLAPLTREQHAQVLNAFSNLSQVLQVRKEEKKDPKKKKKEECPTK